MARPIKEIPTLRGEDAKRFEEEIKANEDKKVSAEEYNRAIETYDMITSQSNIG